MRTAGNPQPKLDIPSGSANHSQVEQDLGVGDIDLLPILSTLLQRWRVIVLLIVVSIASTWLLTTFVMTRWYRAVAILRPVERSGRLRRGGEIFSQLEAGGGGVAAASLMASGGLQDSAQELITILQTFTFTTSLIGRHHLGDELLPRIRGAWWAWARRGGDPRWQAYRLMQSRFSCDYSMKTGNVTVYYQDPDRANAARILTFYVNDLREQLRRKQLQQAKNSTKTLQEEIRVTSDPLLLEQLEEMMAVEIEEGKLSQMEADFAFAVIEPPVTPDRPFRPRVVLDCVLAGLLAALCSILWASYSSHLDRVASRSTPSRPLA